MDNKINASNLVSKQNTFFKILTKCHDVFERLKNK